MAEKTDAELLAEAKAALHAILTGTRAVRIRYNERDVSFSEVNIDQLRLYIAELEGKVDPCKRRRPLTVSF